jgi:hypothetical protein
MLLGALREWGIECPNPTVATIAAKGQIAIEKKFLFEEALWGERLGVRENL